jgi:2,4-dienoyl-CoA reductase-like NADH-dependent reductase (Old Yellow Enzyme family)
MKNRFALAPLTNCQSHADGVLSEEEFRWLTMRAEGGFGMTMTCAAHVQPNGRAFPGQLGAFSDGHIEGLARLASAINTLGSVSIAQLHHGGMRSPAAIVGQPVAPSEDGESGARALDTAEVEEVARAFVEAAVRVESAGFHGVELHSAHGYLLAEFLSPEMNRRTDRYGGSLENRARLLLEILDGVRARTGPDFMLGLRLSPERFGLRLGEIRELAAELIAGARIEFLDVSLWDFGKAPEEPGFGDNLMRVFAELPRGQVRVGCAGKITSGGDVRAAMAGAMDFVFIGRAAIVHHDYVRRYTADPDFVPRPTPVPESHLRAEGVSPAFMDYLRTFPRAAAMAEPEPAD